MNDIKRVTVILAIDALLLLAAVGLVVALANA